MTTAARILPGFSTYYSAQCVMRFGEVDNDYRNQMAEYADLASGETHVYRYDVLGRRTAKVVDLGGPSEEVTQYFYNGIHAIEEQSGSNVVTATYVYGRSIDEVLSMRRGGQDYFFHVDDMGNVMKITNASAVVVEGYEYRDYGEVLDGGTLAPIAASSIGNPLFFTGARLDSEVGLYHLRSRYMDPQVGRFTTRDSIGIWGDNDNRGNAYVYVRSNPWSLIDPFGTAAGGLADVKFGGKGYKSADDAAIAAIRGTLPGSIKSNVEYGGHIVKDGNGTFGYTAPTKGGVSHVYIFPLPKGVVSEGRYHTHTADPRFDGEHFSPNDLNNGDKNKRPEYLGTPSGKVLKYDPNLTADKRTDKIKQVGTVDTSASKKEDPPKTDGGSSGKDGSDSKGTTPPDKPVNKPPGSVPPKPPAGDAPPIPPKCEAS